jgi:hypothetical protein
MNWIAYMQAIGREGLLFVPSDLHNNRELRTTLRS